MGWFDAGSDGPGLDNIGFVDLIGLGMGGAGYLAQAMQHGQQQQAAKPLYAMLDQADAAQGPLAGMSPEQRTLARSFGKAGDVSGMAGAIAGHVGNQGYKSWLGSLTEPPQQAKETLGVFPSNANAETLARSTPAARSGIDPALLQGLGFLSPKDGVGELAKRMSPEPKLTEIYGPGGRKVSAMINGDGTIRATQGYEAAPQSVEGQTWDARTGAMTTIPGYMQGRGEKATQDAIASALKDALGTTSVAPGSSRVGPDVGALMRAMTGGGSGQRPQQGGGSPLAQAMQPPAAPYDFQSYTARLRGAESGGNPNARNPNSTATGLDQFTLPTWTNIMQSRPDLGLTASGRTDPAQSTKALQSFTESNRAGLAQTLGRAPSAGETYLAHFAGLGGANKLLTADPSTPVDRLLSPDAIAANKSILQGKTAGDVVGWARGKMGEGAGAPAAPAQPAAYDLGPRTQFQAPPDPTKRFDQASKLRDDFSNLQPVKDFRETLTILDSMEEAAQRGGGTADINLVYGLSKIIDPGAAVMNGDRINIEKSGGPIEQIRGLIDKAETGQGFTDAVRAQIMTEARSRAKAQETGYRTIENQFGEMATRAGIDPRDVLVTPRTMSSAAAAKAAGTQPGATRVEGTYLPPSPDGWRQPAGLAEMQQPGLARAQQPGVKTYSADKPPTPEEMLAHQQAAAKRQIAADEMARRGIK